MLVDFRCGHKYYLFVKVLNFCTLELFTRGKAEDVGEVVS